ncbi:hypothetical protein WJR50_33175 [Catalinimonas sp. 4WD22]|uniref:hypothetical protein n=1 Tax=Catalinimonas locisalis TaxID=3133978 RepID=UPI00310107A6
MKTSKFYLLLLIWFCLSTEVFAQGIPVMDVTHIAMTVANSQILNDQLDKLNEQVMISYRIEEKVGEIYDLQYNYQEFLKQAESIQELQWANLENSEAQALSIATSMDAYVPGFDGIERLKDAYQNPENENGAMGLYQELDGFGADNLLPASLDALQTSLSTLSVNRAAFDEMAYKKKLQVALSYHEMAQDLLEKAEELSQALLVNERFSMTEGERLSSIKQAHDYILQSIDLKLQSDQLILEVMEAAKQSKTGPIKQYEQQLEREVLANTPLY